MRPAAQPAARSATSRPLGRRWWLGAAVGLIVATVSTGTVGAGAFQLVSAGAVIVAIRTTRRMSGSAARAWRLLAGGFILFGLGDTVWAGYQLATGSPPPFPSIADVFYLGTYPLLASGLVRLMPRSPRPARWPAVLDTMIVLTGVGLLSWEFLIRPNATDWNAGLLERAISTAYPMFDLLLLYGAIRLVLRRVRGDWAATALAASITALLAYDTLYALRSGFVGMPTSLERALYLCAYLAFVAAVTRRDADFVDQRVGGGAEELSAWRLLSLGSAVYLPVIVTIVVHQIEREGSDAGVFIAGGTLLALLLARLLLVVRALQRTVTMHREATNREHALRLAGGALVAATTIEEIYETAVRSAVDLAEDLPHVRASLAMGDCEQVEVMATRGHRAVEAQGAVLRPRRFPEPFGAALEQLSAVDATAAPALDIPDSGDIPGGVATVPLVVDGVMAGCLVVSAAVPIPTELREALVALGSQLSLSVARAQLLEARRLDGERLQEQRFQSLVQNAADVVSVVGSDAVISYMSPSSSRVLGYAPEELVGGVGGRLLHPDDRERVATVLATIAPGASTAPFEVQLVRADGQIRSVELVISNLSEVPSIAGFVVNARDVTERRQLEVELRHAQKLEAVGRLAAGIAHEINTPIQFVGDNLHFLEQAFDTMLSDADADLEFLREEVPEAVRQARDGVQRVATIVQAMKFFGHPDEGTKRLADLNEALSSTLTVARNEYKYVAELECEFGDLPPIRCHPGDLKQVFLNLVVNAAHAIAEVVGAGPERGRITIRSWLDDGDAVITVADTGIGIRPEHQAHVFEPFFTTKPPGRGTGQGLSLARAMVVDRHHGALTFETTPGRGTTFMVRLPITTDPSEIARSSADDAFRERFGIEDPSDPMTVVR